MKIQQLKYIQAHVRIEKLCVVLITLERKFVRGVGYSRTLYVGSREEQFSVHCVSGCGAAGTTLLLVCVVVVMLPR